MSSSELVSKLSIRARQAIGAIALHEYCAKFGVLTQEIRMLVDHQFSVLIAHHLPSWEAEGARLPINGRGDPLPADIEDFNPSKNSGLLKMIDFSTEIGLSSIV